MNKYIKIVFAVLMVAFGAYLIIERQLGWGITLIVLAAIPVLLFFKNEYILLSFWQMRKQNFPGAARWLTRITNYQSQLHRSQFGYFHYLQGLTLAQDNPAKTEAYMRKSLEFGLNMKHDRALANLNLAATALSKGRKIEAQKYLEEAKKLDTADMMGEQIKMLRDQIKMPSMQKHMHNPNMRQRGKHF